MKRKYRRVLLFFLILFIICIIIILMVKFFHNLNTSSKKINVVDSVENYDYVLEDRDTVLYKNLFNELKTLLKEDSINQEKYAELVSKLFVVDLFTLDNKLSKYDVGGIDFVYPDNLDNYKLDVEETLYKTIVNNADGKRRQNLPIVKDISLESIEKGTFKIKDQEQDSFICKLSWKYEKDDGYEDNAIITLVTKDKKMYIVEYKKAE